jgi:oxygen-dependent protoporphyrinogen oxidase
MPKHVVILGAGISGLSTAWFLKKKLGSSIQLTLLEESHQSGGWIQTIQSEDFLFETGPRSCRTRGTGLETLQLIEELGLHNQIIGADPSANIRFLYYQQKLQSFPSSVFQFPFHPLLKGWKQAVWRDWQTSPSLKEDESIEEFCIRHFGKEWCDRLIDPFVSGIYAGDAKKLSVKSCFPQFWNWDQQHGSLIRGMWNQKKEGATQTPFVAHWARQPIFSFKSGMSCLIRALENQLEGDIHFSQPAKNLKMDSDGITIELNNKKLLQADYLISTIPALKLASLFQTPQKDISAQLQKMESTTVMVINLGYRESILKKAGFGYLIPFQEKESILGCVWDSVVFPSQNCSQQTRLTVMMGGAQHPFVIEDKQKSVELALTALEKHLNLKKKPDVIHVTLARQAIPQYVVGHHQMLNQISQLLSAYPHLAISGHSFDGVSINDRILQARLLSNKLAVDWFNC